jgi:hypothetical protein
VGDPKLRPEALELIREYCDNGYQYYTWALARMPSIPDQAVSGGGIERRGLWGTSTNKNPPEDWDVYPEITSVHQSASDHAAIFVDVNI